MKANAVNLMVRSGVRTRQCYFYLTFQGLNLYEKDIFGDIKQTNKPLFLELNLGNRGITPTLQVVLLYNLCLLHCCCCSGLTDTHWRPLHKSALTFVACRASLMVSGFAVLWWVVSACSSASWTPLTQGSYLAFVPTRDWCPTAIGTAPVGQKDGPSTETFKINEKQGKKKITVQAAK